MSDVQMDARPPLSVVIALRDGLRGIDDVLAGLLPQARRTGAEVLLVGPIRAPVPDPARAVHVDSADIFRLRLAGIEAARGEVVAIGEDHAVPQPDWCAATIRAHAEHPDAPAIVGCLVNITDTTLSGRGNFLSFAAPFAPPMPELPQRPPPGSAISFKRSVLEEARGRVGYFETVLMPRLSDEGRLVADDRILVDHRQDQGIAWSIANAFHSARASYGYASRDLAASERARRARWSAVRWTPRLLREARAAGSSRRELAMVAVVSTAAGVGGAVGSVFGPGRSPQLVA
jgi:hypothetical protein